MKSNTIYAILIIGILLIIFSYMTTNPSTKVNMSEEGFDKTCIKDSDCAKVSTIDNEENCCSSCGVEAISKNAESFRKDWSSKNCLQHINCPLYDCAIQRFTKPACIQNICTLVEIESMDECGDNPYCLVDLARKRGDLDSCDMIKSKLLPCFQNFYFDCLINVAENKSNKEMCNFDSTFDEVCSETTLKNITNSEEYSCSSALRTCKIENLNSLKVECLSKTAKNISDCDNIPYIDPQYRSPRTPKDECYIKYATNVSHCAQIMNSRDRDICIWHKAKNIQDCLLIANEKTEKDPNDYTSLCTEQFEQ